MKISYYNALKQLVKCGYLTIVKTRGAVGKKHLETQCYIGKNESNYISYGCICFFIDNRYIREDGTDLGPNASRYTVTEKGIDRIKLPRDLNPVEQSELGFMKEVKCDKNTKTDY